MQGRKEGWSEALKALANPSQFIETLKNLDINELKEKNIKKIGTLPRDGSAMKVSMACASICQFLLAVHDLWKYQKPKILLEQKKKLLNQELQNEKLNLSKSEKKSAKSAVKQNTSKIEYPVVDENEFNPYRYSVGADF